MNDLHFSDEQVAMCADALSTGDLSALPKKLVKHLEDCDACAHQVAFVSEIGDRVPDLKPQIKTRKLMPVYWFSAAAVILLLIALGFLAKSSFNNEPQLANGIKNTVEPVIIKPENTIHEQPTKVIANKVASAKVEETETINDEHKTTSDDLLAYATNAEMEKLVDRFSNGAMRGDAIEVINPVLIEGQNGELVLEWTNEDSQELIVEFFYNNGEKLFEVTTTKSSIKVDKLKKPALYYWKLINEDYDLIFCGKIKIVS